VADVVRELRAWQVAQGSSPTTVDGAVGR
jgi:hypothetical protein